MKSSFFFSLITITFIILVSVPESLAQEISTPGNQMVRLIYFLPRDRSPRPDRVKALRHLIKDAQQFYADEMQRHGFGRKTFTVETDKDGEPVVHHVHGQFNENYYYTRFTGLEVWKEFFEHADDPQHIYFFAIDLSNEILSNGNTCGTAGVNYFSQSGDTVPNVVGPGPLAMRYANETQGEEVLGGAAAIPASGSCYERIGLTLHELGHAFGLPHDFREGINNDYVMSYGHTKKRLSECAAEWLSVSPFFNTRSTFNNSPGSIQLISTPTYSSDGVSIRFKVTDADGLYQAQLLGAEVTEQGSWKDDKLYDCKQLNGKTSTIEFISQTLTIDNIMLQIIDRNGSITWATFSTDIASLLPAAEMISIPDANLAAAVRTELGLEHSAPITDMEMKNLTGLTYSGRDLRDNLKITDLTGLEYATSLEHLYLYGHRIHDIRPLAKLKSLKELILDQNAVRDISPVANLTQLTWLLIGGNPISDFTPLANLNQLEGLALWGGHIGDVKLLANKTKLTHLWVSGNNISNIAPLANLTHLKVLELRENRIKNINPLLSLKKLEELSLRGNPIQDFSPLRTLLKQNPTLKLDIEIPPPSPVVRVDASQRPPMYWVNTDDGTLHRLIGDNVENLASSVQNATDLAIDMTGGKLYWTERTSDRAGKIRQANLDGTDVQLVKNLTSVPYSIALDTANGKIYLTNAWGKIQRMNLDGSNFQPNLITGLESPRHLVLDGTSGKVYWTETTEASGRIRRANLDGSNVQNVATGLAKPLSLAVSNNKVYWTEGTAGNGGKLQRANLDGTNSEVLETLPLAPTSIAVDPARNSFYLTTPSGEIHRRDLNGSGDEPVVTGLVPPTSIVLGITATTPGPTDAPEPPATPVVDTSADVNQDKKVNKTDLLMVVTALGESPPANPNFDVNADGSVNIADVLLVIEALDDPVAAAAPSFGETITSLEPRRLAMQIDILRAESDGSMKYAHAIAFFQSLLASIRPTETVLFANYPNPFNPETWIPYRLAESADVSIAIYAADGRLVRRLDLGHQAVGIYESRSRAAYWDGRNDVGESVASSVYFYTLTAGDFTATRKMLMLK